MAVDIQNLFNEVLPKGIAQHADQAKQVGATFQMSISGDGGGEWFIDLKSDPPSATAGNPGGADCTIKISAEDFQKLHENPQANGMQLFFAGKLKLQGNQMLGMKLGKLFTLGA
jgi:putative sterol carrier protein